MTDLQPPTPPTAPPVWSTPAPLYLEAPAPPLPVAGHRAARRHLRGRALVAAGALTVAAVAVGIAVGSHDSSTPKAPTAAAAKPSAAATAADATTPAPVENITTQMDHWWSGVSDTWTAITDDLQSVGNAASAKDVSALASACITLSSDLQTMSEKPAAPDSAIADDIYNAVGLYKQSAQACISGDHSQSAQLADRANPYLDAATARVKELTGTD